MARNVKSASGLSRRKCRPCRPGSRPLSDGREYLGKLNGWDREGGKISRRFRFKDYGQVAAFVNAVAWIAQAEDHHPDVEFGTRTCRVSYSTHAAGGLTENDFICAAKIDLIYGNPKT